MDIYFLVISISLLFSAFFSGMEIAFVSANRIHIELEKKQDGVLAYILTRITEKPSKFIATMLIGNNLSLVVYSYFMGKVLMKWFPTPIGEATAWYSFFFEDFGLFTHTVISTLIIFITAEFLPKVFFQIYSNTLLKLMAIPAYIFYILFSGFSWLVMQVSDFILKTFFKTAGDEVQLSFSKMELGDYISEQVEGMETDEEIDSEIQIFQNALEFAEVKAREVMVPRTEICAIEMHESPSELRKLFTETGYSKIFIFKQNIDEIIGYTHSFELFRKPNSIKSILRSVEYVPETMLIQDILNVLTRKRKSVAVVIDEYGGTSGILTVEDIIEELFGEIEDEHDSTDLQEDQLGDGRYCFSARLEVDYLNEQYKLALPEGEEYETLGGLIVHLTEEIPEQQTRVETEDYHFIIREVSNNKIDLVEVQKIQEN